MKTSKTRIGEVRLCYVHLAEPHQIPGSNTPPKYSVNVLISKEDKGDLEAIQKEYENAIKRGVQQFGPSFQAKATPLKRAPGSTNGLLIDCDADERYKDNNDMKGFYMMSLKASTAPFVMAKECGMRNLTPDEIKEYVYSGCVGYVTFDFYPYSNVMTGITAGLGNVCKTQDGPFMGGRASASSDFSDLFGNGGNDDFSDLL